MQFDLHTCEDSLSEVQDMGVQVIILPWVVW